MQTTAQTTVSTDDINRILYADHHDPFAVLGAHLIHRPGQEPVLAIRAYLPGAPAAWVVEGWQDGQGAEHRMEMAHPEGFFEAVFPDRQTVFPYRLKRALEGGGTTVFHDSYSFLPTLTEFDIYLFNAGNHHRIYEKLGAHACVVNGIAGVQFAVWAPSARSVSVIGDFNGWDRRRHAMRVLGSSGVWEIFIPALNEGELYKFEVKGQNGVYYDKSDPYGFEMEVRPNTASRVNFLEGFTWHDQDWMDRRRTTPVDDRPMAVYEVHLASWRRGDVNSAPSTTGSAA